MEKKNLIKAIAYLVSALAAALLMAFGLSSCNVTRTVTTESQSIQRGDTAVNIVTRTTETYDASKKFR